jgi:GNAT superfamily N-acetyltransferase
MDIIEITKQKTKDIEILTELMHQQMLDINSEKNRSSIESAVRNALKPESRAMFFLGKQNDIPVGVVFINICSGIESGGDYVWINELQILPEFRGKGFGSKLIKHVIKWAESNKMKAILSMSDIENTASQSLFKSAGFVVEDIKWMKRI